MFYDFRNNVNCVTTIVVRFPECMSSEIHVCQKEFRDEKITLFALEVAKRT